jgi:pimeloyl-ACP methyl ester carboxylesterase
MSVADSRVAGNTSWLGGGLANFGTLELTRTLVNDNSAQTLAGVLGGGGIGSAGPLTVIDSTISGNDAVGTGGGIGSFGNATLTGSTVSGNSAGTSGGGIVSAGGALSLSNSTISGNSALENGGGITFAAESVSLNNVTVTNNRADSDANGSGDGGGINGASGVTTLANTIIAGNADGGGEAPDCAGPLFSEGYNLIQNTVGCPFVIGLGDITGQNPKLGRLANDGGPTLTHALRRGSPAIDAGNPAPPGGYPTCETTDQRGVARPEDGDSDGVARCDIGAYERRAVDGEPDGVIELPVAFQVTNSNTTSAACPFDNAEYTVRGSIVGPESAIYGPAPRAVTVYVHGFSQSEGNWAFTAVPGYDLPVEMAKLGHISLNINRPGYSPSDHPPGMLSCVGTAADVTHQIIGQLRSPGATLPDGEHVSFSKIVLAGHDSGGTMVEVEAYSYKDIDGLFVSSFADTGFSQRVTEWSVEAGALCMQGGELSDRGAPNYHTFPPIPDEEFANDEALLREIFYNTDEAVFQAIKQSIATGGRQLNPCGDIGSVPGAVASNLARLHEVTVPVLYLLGDHDIGFTKEGGERQGALYSGSDDVTSLIMEDTPHFWMWGRTAPDARSMVSEWLCSRGFVSAGSACGSEAGHR